PRPPGQIPPLARKFDFRLVRADGDFEEFSTHSGKKYEPLVGTYSSEGYSMVETTKDGSGGISTPPSGKHFRECSRSRKYRPYQSPRASHPDNKKTLSGP